MSYMAVEWPVSVVSFYAGMIYPMKKDIALCGVVVAFMAIYLSGRVVAITLDVRVC